MARWDAQKAIMQIAQATSRRAIHLAAAFALVAAGAAMYSAFGSRG